MQFPSFVRAIEQFTDRESGFHSAWANWEEWREDYINGEDDIIGTNPATGIDDDRRDPCDPPPRRPGGGGGGGGGSGGGPGILH